MADSNSINAVDLTQETVASLDGAEQFVMFDVAQGKRATLNNVGKYILTKQTTINSKTVKANIDEISQDISEIRASVGSPLVAVSSSNMTDKTRIYVYTGSESGFESGHWYYWDGKKWTDGGVYNSTAVQTDKTLLIADAPADAKTVGDILRGIKAEDSTGEGDIVLSFGA